MSADRPNILLFLADDLGWADVGYHGSRIRTPHLDRLAATGTILDHHYVSPVCTPTRACLLTGRYPSRFGVHATGPTNLPVMPDGHPTVAGVLRDRGYRTGLFGKWHLGSHPRFAPNAFGFDASYGSLAGGVDPYSHRYKRGPYTATWHRDGQVVDDRGHVTDLILAQARSWIEAQREPWFCYVPFTAVHIPIKPPESWVAAYHGESFDDEPAKDVSFRKYAAYASHMDWAVGQLLETLDTLCVRESTLVIFSSDNGALDHYPASKATQYPGYQEDMPRLGSNAPLRGQKGQLYEGGIRTPTILNWRSMLPAQSVGAALHIVDWLPTLARLAGDELEADVPIDGLDIWPMVDGSRSGEPAKRVLYWNRGNTRFSVREGRWKLITRPEYDPVRTELFDVERDPEERVDRCADEPDVVRRLTGRLEEQRALDDTARRADVP